MTLLGMEGFKRSFEECKSQKQTGPNRSERGIRTGHFGPGTSIDNLRDPHDKKLKIRFINRNKGKKNEGKKKLKITVLNYCSRKCDSTTTFTGDTYTASTK